MLEGALTLLAGILVGRFMPGRRRRPKPLADPKPICGCGHHVSFHGDGKGPCAWEGEKFYRSGVGTVKPTCKCLRYVGPEVYPVYTSEIGA